MKVIDCLFHYVEPNHISNEVSSFVIISSVWCINITYSVIPYNVFEMPLLLQRCKSRDIKLCGLLAAAGLIAARSLNGIPDDQWEKYAITTLVDCRSILDPVLSSHHIGKSYWIFYSLIYISFAVILTISGLGKTLKLIFTGKKVRENEY